MLPPFIPPAFFWLCLAEMSSAESGGILSCPSVNFEATSYIWPFDQELLSMAHTCLRAEPLGSHAADVERAHRYI